MNTTDKPTLATHRYYRSTLVPMYAREAGFESHQEAHRGLMAGFAEMHPDDPNLPSMADMSHAESVRYVDWVIRQLSEMGFRGLEPRKERA